MSDPAHPYRSAAAPAPSVPMPWTSPRSAISLALEQAGIFNLSDHAMRAAIVVHALASLGIDGTPALIEVMAPALATMNESLARIATALERLASQKDSSATTSSDTP